MLPQPTSERFKPLRSGLINLYKYEDQEFWFEHGRLLLRGNNGTGKSRVLALQLPFLFDGDISPHRVEPDGDPAKALAWHLLMNEYDDRIGYTWIEFGRISQGGPAIFVTLGCGMRAIKGVDGLPNRWYFVTDQRVGEHFTLLSEGRQPLSRDQLTAILGETSLYRTAQDYRREVDSRLFGLKARYDSLIELLIRLRAPQLARKLDEDRLSGALSDALPPLGEALVEDLAESFRNLDSLRDDLENHRQIEREVSEFLTAYRRYLQTAARRRADAVRSHHSRYEEINRDITEKTRIMSAAEAEIQRAELAKKEAERAALEASARLAALRDSPYQQDAAALVAAHRESDLCQAQLAQAVSDDEGLIKRADEALTDQEGRKERYRALEYGLGDLLESLRQTAKRASFLDEQDRHLPMIAQWPGESEWLAATETAFRGLVRRRDESIVHLVHLHSLCVVAQNALSHAQAAETAAEQRVITERESERLQDEQIRSLSEQLTRNYAAWMVSLVWLRPMDGIELADNVSRWIETGQTVDRALPTLLERAIAEAEGERRRGLAEVERSLKESSDRISVLESEKSALLEGRRLPPLAPATRDPQVREQVDGAPLWQVCDFRDTLTEAEQAGLEAALESAGLLDALITPEGDLIPRTACDTFLAPASAVRVTTTNLTSWLLPSLSTEDSRTALTAIAIEAALGYIGAAAGNGDHWVDTDGSWQLGPLQGRGRKPVAEHIGEGARERSRRKRLTELDQEISLHNAERTLYENRRHDLAVVRAEAIRLERTRAPSDNEIATTLTLRGATRERLATLRREYEVVQSATTEARRKHQSALGERERAAADLGLAEWQERLDSLKQSWLEYSSLLERLWPTAYHWNDARQQVEHATKTLERARADSIGASTRRQRAESKLVEATTRYDTLFASVGASVAKLQSDMRAASASEAQAKEKFTAADGALLNAWTQAGVAEVQLSELNTKLSEAVRDRLTAIERAWLLAQYGLFAEAHPNFGEFEAGPWSVTRAVDISREIERTLRDVASDDNAWRSRQTLLLNAFNELQTSLGAHGHQPQIEYADDSLVTIACPFHGRPLRLGQLHAAVTAEIATQERLLTEREREVIDNHLIGEVATTLQDLIRDAESKVIEMNAEIERCSTGTGLTMRLKWGPLDEGIPDGLPRVRGLLLADSELWTPEERTQIGAFLHGLIQDARLADPSGVWADHLRRALDYRAWHRFSIERRQNDRWERLTRRRYGTGSGGEKALMLTVPQMAAAASHYRSAASYAPRLILLDEVFVGIDASVRAKCMGLLEAFDLDFIMTSEREWGAYPTIKGLAIYQLITHPGIDAIATIRWVWNGKQRILANPLPPHRTIEENGKGVHAG